MFESSNNISLFYLIDKVFAKDETLRENLLSHLDIEKVL